MRDITPAMRASKPAVAETAKRQATAQPGTGLRARLAEARTITRLSLPVALTQVGLMLTGVVDTLMVSRIHTDALAASALGNMWQWSLLSLGMGLVMGIDPLISQAHGRGDGPATALALQRGLVLATLVSLPICLALAYTDIGLRWLGQSPRVAALALEYNRFKLPMVPLFLAFNALRQYLQGRTLMAPATWVMWAGNAINVVLNWALIFGHLGLPALGLRGAAIASSLTTLFWALALWGLTYGLRLHRGAWQPWSRHSFSLAGLSQTARLGIPVGLQMALEAWAFSLATIMAGWISVDAVGSHQIVLNMAALAFMLPLGISMGAATRVGNLIGADKGPQMRAAVWAAMGLGAAVMTVSATLFVTLSDWLPRLYTDDPVLCTLASGILPLAGFFQLADGVQVVGGGVLRGMGRPQAAAVVNLVGYYGLALPLAYTLAFKLEWGLYGIWVALGIGLFAVALALAAWIGRTARRPLAQLRVNAAG